MRYLVCIGLIIDAIMADTARLSRPSHMPGGPWIGIVFSSLFTLVGVVAVLRWKELEA